MTPLEIIVSAAFIAAWAIIIGLVISALLRPRLRCKRFARASAVMIAMGVASFLAHGVAHLVPPSFEWPIGFAGSVLTTPSGLHVVGHDAANRVQIYDTEWKFLRGWPIDARGGIFTVAMLPDEQVEVITARGDSRFVFDVEGKQLSKGPAPQGAFSGSVGLALGPYVPTWPWLWTLAHPFIAWLIALLGMLTLALARAGRTTS